jgi:hypothetical protein
MRNNSQYDYGYLNMVEEQDNNNINPSQNSNDYTNVDYNNIYNKENNRANDKENDIENLYKRKTNKNKNNFLRSTNYAGNQLNYNHHSNFNIHNNKINMDDMSEFDNNKEELFKKYEAINNQEKFAKMNKNITLNNDNMIQMEDEEYLTQKSKKAKNNFVNPNKNNESLDSNDNIDDNINSLINKNSSKLYRQKMFNDKNDYNSSINKYQSEINKLKKEIESLENSNDILSNQLKEEEKRNEELNIIKNEKEENDNSILLDISHCLQVNSFDEILPKLTEMINYLNKYNNDENSKIKEDLISKLKSLYIATNDIKESKDNISIQDLWRWIKQLINNVKQLSVEKDKNEEIYKQNNYEIYKNYCEKLIKEFGLNSFDELKFFINDLLTKNNLNKKRVEKLKKVLMNNNEKEESTSSAYNNNDENDYENLMMNNNERINGNKKYNLNYRFNDDN